MKIGVDIVDVERFENLSKAFIERVYTKNEIEYCEKFTNKQERFAGFFCAKEAFLKALDCNIEGLSLSEIEVSHKENGAPIVILYGNVKKIFSSITEKNISLSLSHSNKTAIAMVLISE